LAKLGDAMRTNALRQVEEANGRTSLEFLSAPRNSLILRFKSEAHSAMRQAYELFNRELRAKKLATRRISAWEMIEGADDSLSIAFAQFTAHVLVHSRLFSSVSAIYSAAWPAAANAVQMKISLGRLLRAAVEYIRRFPSPDFTKSESRKKYFGQGGGNSWMTYGLERAIYDPLPCFNDYVINPYGSS